MKHSTGLKRSTASDTGIKKNNRWFRIGSHRGEIEQLFDLYWGGKERRITGMTLRILGVNFIALVALIFGVVYLGQYHSTLIKSKLERFETKIVLVSAALTEGAVEHSEALFSKDKATVLATKLAATLRDRILIFDADNQLVVDSAYVISKNGAPFFMEVVKEQDTTLQSIEMLKKMASWITSIFPEYDRLAKFPGVLSQNGADYSNVVDARLKRLSISAWRDVDDGIVLTAAMPIFNQERMLVGVVMLVNDDGDILHALGDMWFNILQIFLVTLFVTVILSIYLSGVIARPLRKLASAAENVRKGKLKHTDIPDMSSRHDEIGELSIVLRDMTHALWDRMDTIEAFAADVAHEIKNPLTSLKSAVETAAIVTKKEDLEKLLDVIRHDIERLDRLITDISSASRLDAELSRETFTVLDLKQVLRGFLDAYKGPLERNVAYQGNTDEALKDGVLITLDMPDIYPELLMLGSEVRLRQVFQNILSNALSFSQIKSQIDIAVQVDDKRVTVSIEDEGPGIPENKVKNIFDRFYSERPEHEEYGRHSGLGLSICKQIITAHNGVIYAENRNDRSGEVVGARFVVILNMV